MGSEQQLRSASDEVLGALDKLHELEMQKRSVSPSDPRFHELAQEIEQLAARLASTAETQSELGEKVAEKHDHANDAAPAIEETGREPMTILTDWRDAERRVTAAVAGSAAEAEARADVNRLRAEYQSAMRR
jgi:peptidoglycan hydrolase CwlO-like protein